MSKNNTEIFFDALDKEISWRKHELSIVKKVIEENKQTGMESIVTREGILMLYAHWEGAVKNISIKYLQYVVDQKLMQKDVSDNFLAIVLKKHINTDYSGKSILTYISATRLLLESSTNILDFNPKKQIKTESNLNYEVFEEILDTLAISKKRYSTKKQQISESLVGNRNRVAHGEVCEINKSMFLTLFEDIISLMTMFKEDVQNLCTSEAYKKHSGAKIL